MDTYYLDIHYELSLIKKIIFINENYNNNIKLDRIF
jgi:hypothetical protein